MALPLPGLCSPRASAPVVKRRATTSPPLFGEPHMMGTTKTVNVRASSSRRSMPHWALKLAAEDEQSDS
jgi:hypothetical protein